ncbi:MAG: NADH-quinone oxidoreductase subunit N [candidate division WOR-3 bacterium]
MKTFIFEISLSITGLIIFILDIILKDKKNKPVILSILTAFFLFLSLIISSFLSSFSLKFGFSLDSFSYYLKILFISAGIIGCIGSIPYLKERIPDKSVEYLLLIIFSIIGMSFLVSSKNILLFFISFELLSIPLYALTGFYKKDIRAPEASLKFLLVGVFSSAILFFGLSFLYGAGGSGDFEVLKEKFKETSPILYAGMIMFLVGIGFKIAAVPFHTWLPDVYEAAPSSYVAFLSVAPKAAGFAALIRFLFEVFPRENPLIPVIALLSAVTMILGNLVALPQTNIKRLLAYSSIAHIGYILIGIASFDETGISMVLFYLFTYLFSNMGAFLIVESQVNSLNDERIDALKGLAQRNPILSLSMLIFLLSLGGIPFVAGFWAKLFVFLAGVKTGYWFLVLLGGILTIVALYYYLMVARRMYIEEEFSKKIEVPLPLKISIGVCTIGVLFFGILPRILVNFSNWAAKGILR